MTLPQRSTTLIILCLFLASCSKPSYLDTKGNEVDLTSAKNHWLALNVWADWCGPCREEIPELNALALQNHIRVVGIDFDGSQGNELKQKATALGITFPVLEQSPLQALNTPVPAALPATYILNAQGEVVETLLGPQTQHTIQHAIQTLQESKSNG